MSKTLRNSALSRYIDYLPHFPKCSNSIKSEKKSLVSRPRSLAIGYDWIQHNPAGQVANLVFDIDSPESFYQFEESELPPPNLIIKNQVNSHCQYLYLMEFPVIKTHTKSFEYLKGVEKAYTSLLDADPHFSGFISKNAVSDKWKTVEIHRDLFELDELAREIPANTSFFLKPESTGEGRNVDLFDSLRFWAYSNVKAARSMSHDQWRIRVLKQSELIARESFIDDPLPYAEIMSVSKSVADFVYDKYEPGTKRHINRGKLSLNGTLPLKERQKQAAEYANATQSSATLGKIKTACFQLHTSNKPINKKSVARASGVSLNSVKKYWSDVETLEYSNS